MPHAAFPIAFAVLVCALRAASAAPVVYVDRLGLCNGLTPCLTTIQAGIAQASGTSAIVNVFPGSYAERVDLSQTGSAVGGPVPLTVRAVNASGVPTSTGVTVSPTSGEAFWNSVDPYPAALTLQGIAVTSADDDAIDIEGITGVVTLEDVVAADAYFDGIDIRTRNDVVMVRVQALRNRNDGIQIRFEAAGDLFVSGSVAEFNRGFGNGDDGFEIDLFDGSATFTDTRASDNGADGIDIDGAPGALRITAVTLTGVTLERNGLPGATAGEYDGLDIENVEPVTLARIPLGDVSVSASQARLNLGGGFDIDRVTGGNHLFETTTASANGRDGVQLTMDGTGAPSIGLPGFVVTARDLLVDGNGTGSGAGGFGLRLRDARSCTLQPDMDLVLLRVAANGNETGGLDLRASRVVDGRDLTTRGNGFGETGTGQGDGVSVGALPVTSELGQGPCPPAQVTLTNVVSEANAGDGLQVDGSGAIAVTGLAAHDNGNPLALLPGQDGVELTQVNPTTAALELRQCSLARNRDDGAHLSPVAGIFVAQCTLSANGADGLDVAVAPGSVAGALEVLDVRSTDNADDGFDVDILGNFTLQASRAERNVSDGLFVKRALGVLTVTQNAFTASGQAGIQLRVLGPGAHLFEANDIVGNVFGVANLTSTATLAFGSNYWGSASGPTHPANPGGSGDSIFDGATGGTGTVSFPGFLAQSALPAAKPQQVPAVGLTGLLVLAAGCACTAGRARRRTADARAARPPLQT